MFNECKHIRGCCAFYVSLFACSWAFAELKRMEGNAKIIKLIARDENVQFSKYTNNAKTFTQEKTKTLKNPKKKLQMNVNRCLLMQ